MTWISGGWGNSDEEKKRINLKNTIVVIMVSIITETTKEIDCMMQSSVNGSGRPFCFAMAFKIIFNFFV